MATKTAKRPLTKSQLYSNISETTELSRKEVGAVLDALTDEVRKALGKRGSGVVSLPGLLKISKKKVPARPAMKNWRNPFTGEIQTRPAKPASTKVQVRALKSLKDMV